jgi:hypothetical protein
MDSHRLLGGGTTIVKQVKSPINPGSPICISAVILAATLVAAFFLAGCSTVSREPGLGVKPTNTKSPSTPTPTPVPVIEIETITVEKGRDAGSWEVFGTLKNISADGLANLEISVSILDLDGAIEAQETILPALQQLSPGDSTAFKAEFSQLDTDVRKNDVRVELSSFQLQTITPLRIAVNQISARPNLKGGTTYLGYFSNPRQRYGEFRNIEAFIINENGEPIDAADEIVTIASIEPRGRVPFQVEFVTDHDETWPEFYIDAVPADNPTRASRLWTVAEPQLFFTSQKVPYYLIEVKNAAYAPQRFEGMLTLTEGIELIGLLPLSSKAPVPAQSSWYFTVEPSLALPIRLRGNETAIRELTPEVIIDSIASRGVSDELISIDLEIGSVETIGGSMYLQGKATNPGELDLSFPVVFAALQNPEGKVITANSELLADSISAGGSTNFTIALWMPSGIEPNTLEFDINAYAIKVNEATEGGG